MERVGQVAALAGFEAQTNEGFREFDGRGHTVNDGNPELVLKKLIEISHASATQHDCTGTIFNVNLSTSTAGAIVTRKGRDWQGQAWLSEAK